MDDELCNRLIDDKSSIERERERRRRERERERDCIVALYSSNIKSYFFLLLPLISRNWV